MATFADVFDAAQSLPVADRVRLMEAIWDRLSPDEWPPPSQEWMAEAQRRSDACDAGAMSVASWSDVRSRARKKADEMADVFIAAGAEQDYAEALAWYAERSHQAANGFEAEIARTLEAIAADPHRYPLCDARHRFCLTQRYPFQVIYRDASYGILVVAIAHAKRRPGYWQNR